MQILEGEKLALAQRQLNLLGRLESVTRENVELQTQLEIKVRPPSNVSPPTLRACTGFDMCLVRGQVPSWLMAS